MNLQYFPMDRQLCHIEIESCKYFSSHFLYKILIIIIIKKFNVKKKILLYDEKKKYYIVKKKRHLYDLSADQ